MSKPIVIIPTNDIATLAMGLLDGSRILKVDGARSYYQLIMLDKNAYTYVFQVLGIGSLSNGEKADLLWLIAHTPHGFQVNDLIGRLQTAMNSKSFLATSSNTLISRIIYQEVFGIPAPVGSINMTNYRELENKECDRLVYVFRSYYQGDELSIGGPCQWLSVNYNSGVKNALALDVNNTKEAASVIGVAEPDVNISLEDILTTILLSDKQGLWSKQAGMQIDGNNYLMFTNKEIAAFWGLDKNYHRFMRDKAQYEAAARLLPNGERFSMWDYFNGTLGNNLISYGTAGNWYPVDLNFVKSPQFIMFNAPAGYPQKAMTPAQVKELEMFLSNPQNVRYGLNVASVLSELRKISNVPVNNYSTRFNSFNDQDKQAILDFLQWCYVYVHVARGLTKSGSYSRQNMKQRLFEETQIFANIDAMLSPDAKAWLKSINVIDNTGKQITLPGMSSNLYDLAANHTICAVFKGLNLHPAAKLVLNSITGGNAQNYADQWMRSTKYKPLGEVYPLSVSFNYESV